MKHLLPFLTISAVLLSATFFASPPFHGAPTAYLSVPLSTLDSHLSKRLCTSGWGSQQNLVCNAAAGRDCREKGFSGGTLQEYHPAYSSANELCTRGSLTTVSFAELEQAMGSKLCSGSGWPVVRTLYCNSAVSRYCRASGFDGGLLQEYDTQSRTVQALCARGQYRQIPLTQLRRFNESCTDNWNLNETPMECATAASRLCRAKGFRGGVIQEYDKGVNRIANVLCL